MATDDTFMRDDPDRTVNVPKPSSTRPGGGGGRRSGNGGQEHQHQPADPFTGVNPLLAAANPVLCLLPQIRGSASHPDPEGLRERLHGMIKTFHSQIKQPNISDEHLLVAHYALCTVVDEYAANTPWGEAHNWNNKGLLSIFHFDTWGRKILPRRRQDAQGSAPEPRRSRISLCMSRARLPGAVRTETIRKSRETAAMARSDLR